MLELTLHSGVLEGGNLCGGEEKGRWEGTGVDKAFRAESSTIPVAF